jgi:predicted porin
MKKLVIASAVAAVMASGTAMSDTTMGGHIRLLLQNQGSMALNSNKLTFDIKASEDLGNGMTGIARVEWENDHADNETTGNHNDLSYVGLKGDFGQLTLGVQDDAAGFACGGTDIFTSNSGNACGVGAVNGPLDNAVVYVKGFDAITLVVGATFDGDLGKGEMVDAGPTQPDSGNHTVIAVNFDGGMFSIGAQITTPDSDAPVLGKAGLDISNLTVIGGTVKLGDGTLGLTFADNSLNNDNTAMAIAYSMPLAGGTIKIGVDQGDALKNAAGDDTITNLEFDKDLGKATYVGVQLSDDSRQADSLFQAIVGYKF